MTNPLGFISQSTENIFKFLFINGLILVATGMLYPLQMSNDIDLKIVEYNKKVNLLNHEINVVAKDIENLNKVVDSRINVSKNLVAKREKISSISKKVEITDEINKMKLETNTSFQEIKKNESERDKNVIRVEGDKKLINHLKSQKKIYDNYCSIFLIFGILIGLIGFIGWGIVTFFIVSKDIDDYKLRKHKNRVGCDDLVTPQDASTPAQPAPDESTI